MNKQLTLQKVIDHIGYLLNSVHPEEEFNKMITLELSTNPQASNMSYTELLDSIIHRLVHFYDDDELEKLWLEYLEMEAEYDESA